MEHQPWVLLAGVATLVACGGGVRSDAADGTGSGADGGDDGQPADDGGPMQKLDVGGDGGDDGGDSGVPGEPCAQAADDQANQGCEFWAVDLPNGRMRTLISPELAAANEHQFAVVVANTTLDIPANVQIFLDNALIDEAVVYVGEARTFNLPQTDIDGEQTNADGRAFHIVSDAPITAYQFQPLDNTQPVYTNDASLLFPVHTFTGDYAVLTSYASLINYYQPPTSPATLAGGFISVIGTEDATEVELFTGTPMWPNDAPTTATIDRGQVFTWISDYGNCAPNQDGILRCSPDEVVQRNSNFTGSRLAATKPVAVFAGVVASEEPLGVSGCCLDHIEHQMLPLSAWGTHYAIAPPPHPGTRIDAAATYRVVGTVDGTKLEYWPERPAGAPDALAAYEWVEFHTDQGFSVVADYPIGLAQFMHSNRRLEPTSEAKAGDPGMSVLTPLAQFQNRYVFLSPQGYRRNFVTIIAPAGTTVELDGDVVANGYAMNGELDGTAYVRTHVQIQPGPHVLKAGAPVGIYVYGYDADVSYSYPGGSGLKRLFEPPPVPQG